MTQEHRPRLRRAELPHTDCATLPVDRPLSFWPPAILSLEAAMFSRVPDILHDLHAMTTCLHEHPLRSATIARWLTASPLRLLLPSRQILLPASCFWPGQVRSHLAARESRWWRLARKYDGSVTRSYSTYIVANISSGTCVHRAKTASPSSWRPWRLLRLAFAVGSCFIVLQVQSSSRATCTLPNRTPGPSLPRRALSLAPCLSAHLPVRPSP